MDTSVLGLLLPLPTATDSKYSRGTVGFVTGSERYPGAALLGVAAAQATAVGFVRYVGPRRVADLMLLAHPEVVVAETTDSVGPTQCWVVGSGIANAIDPQAANVSAALAVAEVAVVDAGALDLIGERTDEPIGHHLLTPHQGELCRLLNRLELGFWHPERLDNPDEAEKAVKLAAEVTGQTVLLKGSFTRVAAANGEYIEVGPNSAWLATAGTGDVLAGLLGGIAAQNSEVAAKNWLDIAQLAIQLHSLAAEIASQAGVVTASTVASAIPQAVRQRFNR